MTTLYFVRHAQPDFSNREDAQRELTEKGRKDRLRVTAFLQGKQIDAVFSSPFRRAVETVEDFAEKAGLPVQPIENFKERKVDEGWIENFEEFAKAQWTDFNYKLPGGESLGEVQQRNVQALESLLLSQKGKSLVVGSHGTALSTLLNYYAPPFEYKDFQEIRGKMPWIVKFTFDGLCCQEVEKIDIEG